MRVSIDPPQGHLYGFPKTYDADQDGDDVNAWLVLQGYPEALILRYGDRFYYRSWPADPLWTHKFEQGVPVRS